MILCVAAGLVPAVGETQGAQRWHNGATGDWWNHGFVRDETWWTHIWDHSIWGYLRLGLFFFLVGYLRFARKMDFVWVENGECWPPVSPRKPSGRTQVHFICVATSKDWRCRCQSERGKWKPVEKRRSVMSSIVFWCFLAMYYSNIFKDVDPQRKDTGEHMNFLTPLGSNHEAHGFFEEYNCKKNNP
jgi:hypothetical protein